MLSYENYMAEKSQNPLNYIENTFDFLVNLLLIGLVLATFYATGIGLIDAVVQRTSVVAVSIIICVVASSWLKNREKYKDTPFRGIIHLLADIFILIVGFLKILFDYRLCTIAYMECKARGVPRDDSYLNRFVDPIVDTRYTDHVYIFTIIAFIIIYYHGVIRGNIRETIKYLKSILRGNV